MSQLTILIIVAAVIATHTLPPLHTYLPLIIASPTVLAATSTPRPLDANTATPIPTPTQTNTPSPTQTNTPSPTPTSTASGVTVLANHSAYVDSSNNLYVIGEIRNDTGTNIRSVRVAVNFFNSQDQLIDTESGYNGIEVMGPGQSSCFQASSARNAAYSYYQFETSYSETTEATSSISILNHIGSYHPTHDDLYEVVGQARNNGSEGDQYARIEGTLYGSNDQVIDCKSGYVNTDTLTPGQTSSWKIAFYHAPEGTVSGYRVQPD